MLPLLNVYFILNYHLFFRKELYFFKCLYFSECDIRLKVSHCVKSAQIRSYFWSAFFCIRTEYGNLLRVRIEFVNESNVMKSNQIPFSLGLRSVLFYSKKLKDTGLLSGQYIPET